MKTLLLLILCFVLATPRAHANSAGNYMGGITVETRLIVTPVHITLSARVTNGTDTSPWTPVTADPSGDGKDVYGSPDIAVGTDTFRWKDGRFQQKAGNGWKNKRRPPKPKAGGASWRGGWSGPTNNTGTMPYTFP